MFESIRSTLFKKSTLSSICVQWDTTNGSSVSVVTNAAVTHHRWQEVTTDGNLQLEEQMVVVVSCTQ